MTGMSGGSNDRPAPDRESRVEAPRSIRGSIWFLEHTQDIVTVAVGIVLIALAAALLISGIVDFADGAYGSISLAGPELLDLVLLVLILVEIVHTVSCRSARTAWSRSPSSWSA